MKIKHIDRFREKYAARKLGQTKRARHAIGVPLFKPEQINLTLNILDRLLRLLCVKEKITVELFNERFKEYACQQLGNLPTADDNPRSSINSQRTNLLKAIRVGNISYFRFNETITRVLGMEIEDISMTIRTPEGDKVTYRLTDTGEYTTEPSPNN